MRRFLVFLLAMSGAAFALGGEVRSLVRTGTFRQDFVDVRWEAEYPVAIPGWSLADLRALWGVIDGYCFLPSYCTEECIEAAKPARPAGLLERVAEKLTVPSTAGISERALDVIAKVRVPFASKDWVGIVYDGYDNEGGNGCHSEGDLCILARKGLEPMPLSWFVRDVPGLKREVIRHLEGVLLKGGQNTPPFGDSWPRAEAEAATPDFFPTPEGVRFRYSAYEILPGCFGLPGVTVPWDVLAPFCDTARLAELKALSLVPSPKEQEKKE